MPTLSNTRWWSQPNPMKALPFNPGDRVIVTGGLLVDAVHIGQPGVVLSCNAIGGKMYAVNALLDNGSNVWGDVAEFQDMYVEPRPPEMPIAKPVSKRSLLIKVNKLLGRLRGKG